MKRDFKQLGYEPQRNALVAGIVIIVAMISLVGLTAVAIHWAITDSKTVVEEMND